MVSDGADATEAAARCFGDLKELEEALRHYVRRYQFRGFVARDLPKPGQTSVSVRMLETAEVSRAEGALPSPRVRARDGA